MTAPLTRSFSELVEYARVANDAKDKRDLARKLGYSDGDEQRKVYEWFRGKRGSFESAVVILDAAGFLTLEARAFLGLPDRQGSDAVREVERAQASAAEVERLARELDEPLRGTGSGQL